jgi:hypothetical protein
MKMTSDSSPRMLLDTNVWRYLVDAGQIGALRALVKSGRARVIVAPAVVYEMLRTRDPDLRRRLVRAATLGAWERLMSEAFDESAAIVDVMREHRPEWVRAEPDMASYLKLRADWRGNFGFWRRARRDPASEARFIGVLDNGDQAGAAAEARQSRSDFKSYQFHSVNLTGWTARPPGPLPGWEGTDLAPWRIQSRDVWWHALARHPEHAYIDWTAPFLDLATIRRSGTSWTHLWFHEVETPRVPREWVRWAVRLLQSMRKVTPGTPGDNQISTYLLDADVFATADRAFVDIAAMVREAGEFATAKPFLVTSTNDPILDLDAILTTHAADARP